MTSKLLSTFKIVLVGDTGVGKTSLVGRFVSGRHDEFINSTIGAAFATKSVIIDGKSIKLYIWDTAGQERFDSLVPMYYRNTAACLCVYDVTSRKSFEKAKQLLKNYQALYPTHVVVMVGNKIDIPEYKWEVPRNELVRFSDDVDCVWTLTDAVNGVNVVETFEELTKRIIETIPNLTVEHSPKKTIRPGYLDIIDGQRKKDCRC